MPLMVREASCGRGTRDILRTNLGPLLRRTGHQGRMNPPPVGTGAPPADRWHARQGEITMPIPQVHARLKEGAVVVLRAVLAGIGQLLLRAEKVRTRAAEQV